MIEKLKNGETYLGIELGSTRIKACLVDDGGSIIATGASDWENRYENGYWTYSLEDIHCGVKNCYKSLKAEVLNKYGVTLKTFASIRACYLYMGQCFGNR